MKIEEFNSTVTEAIDKVNNTLLAKRKEYGRNSNPFHNFERAADISMHKTREAVAWEFMVKHLQSLRDLVNDVENGNFMHTDNHIIDEKCIDIINYTLLIRGMLIERTQDVG